MKKILITILSILMVFPSLVFASQFLDMSENHWAYSNVILMQEKGVINGFEDGTFRPDEKVTREQFARMLVKAFNLTNVNKNIKYEDINDSRWSANDIYIVSDYLTGYTIGKSIFFRPEEEAVREDVAVALVKVCGLEKDEPKYELLNNFSDKDQISESLKSYVALAVEHGFMKGNTDGTFNPLGKLTRAEAVTLLNNVLETGKIDLENNNKDDKNDKEDKDDEDNEDNDDNVDIEVTKVSLNKSSLTIKRGEKESLIATITPSDATDKSITWTSSDPSIVSVRNGVITGIGIEKSATITATASNGKKATCKVTVECDHYYPNVSEYTDITDKTHTEVYFCVGCLNPAYDKKEVVEHTYDDNGICKCGYKKESVTDSNNLVAISENLMNLLISNKYNYGDGPIISYNPKTNTIESGSGICNAPAFCSSVIAAYGKSVGNKNLKNISYLTTEDWMNLAIELDNKTSSLKDDFELVWIRPSKSIKDINGAPDRDIIKPGDILLYYLFSNDGRAVHHIEIFVEWDESNNAKVISCGYSPANHSSAITTAGHSLVELYAVLRVK